MLKHFLYLTLRPLLVSETVTVLEHFISSPLRFPRMLLFDTFSRKYSHVCINLVWAALHLALTLLSQTQSQQTS